MSSNLLLTLPPKAPLSHLHGMLEKVRRERHAGNFNRLLNDPAVYPWVHGAAVGPLDMTGILAQDNMILLMGQFGGILYERHQPGLFEIHCQCYKEGRGDWMFTFATACQHWIFTKTECAEVMTRCPKGNIGAKALARKAGLEFLFRNEAGWVMNNKPIPADILSIDINHWMQQAPGLVERGTWFHLALLGQAAELGHHGPPLQDDTYMRYLGAAVEMIMAGQPYKAAICFNRYAALSSYTPMMIKSVSPLAIVFGQSTVIFRDTGGFYIASIFNQSPPEPAN